MKIFYFQIIILKKCHNAGQFLIACNLYFNSKKEFIKHTLTNELTKQSEICFYGEDDDVSADTIHQADDITEADTITKDGVDTITKDKAVDELF